MGSAGQTIELLGMSASKASQDSKNNANLAVHKSGCPTRPILSAIGTYNYKVVQFGVPILQPLTSGLYTVNDSFFANEITFFNIDSDFVIASFNAN